MALSAKTDSKESHGLQLNKLLAMAFDQSTPASTGEGTHVASAITAYPTLQLYSCLSCRRRKKRCNRLYPCNNCQRLGTECVFAERRVSTRQTPSAIERLRHLEGVVARLRSDIEVRCPVDDQGTLTDNSGRNRPQVKKLDKPSDDSCTSTNRAEIELEAEFGRLAVANGRSRYVVSSFWARLDEEVEDLKSLLKEDANEAGSFEFQHVPTSIPYIFGACSAHPFDTSIHPAPYTIPLYWQLFKENCDPLIKVLHVPTTELLILHAAEQLSCLSPGLETLMFAMYFSVVASLSAGECLQFLGTERDILLRSYRSSLEQALARAQLLETEEMIVLQAFVIFLTVLRNHCSIRLMWTLTCLAARLAQNAGLHRDGTHFDLPPFVVEMRRRLWWSICVLDCRAAEDTGYDAAIPNDGIDTQIPLNVNDSDLDPDMTKFPEPAPGRTSMTFSIIRFEATKTFRRLQYVAVASLEKGNDFKDSLSEKSRWVLDCQKRLYDAFLKHLDLSDAFSGYIVAVSRIVFTKMWLLAHHSCLRGDKCTGLRQETKDRLFTDSIGAIEYWLLLITDSRTRKWRWLCETYVQWYALTFVLSQLCVRTNGALVERAWKAVDEAFQLGLKTPVPGQASHPDLDLNGTCNDAYKPLARLLAKARSARAHHLSLEGIEVELQTSRETGGATYETLAEAAMFESDKLDPVTDGFNGPTPGSFSVEPGAGAPVDWSVGAEITCPYIDGELWTSTNWDLYQEDY